MRNKTIFLLIVVIAVFMSVPIWSEEQDTKEELWTLQKELNLLGPRFTGNEAHQKFINLIKSELDKYSIDYKEDVYKFNRWEAQDYSLKVDEINIPVSFYYPYSGITSAEGVTAPLIFCKSSSDFRKAKGKIVVVKAGVKALPTGLLFKIRNTKPGVERLPTRIKNPVVASVLNGHLLKKAKKSGALGAVLIWEGISADNAKGQYLPFTSGYKDFPVLWVDSKNGERLLSSAEKDASATLTLNARLELSETSTIYAVIPGKSKTETVIVNTHTDGTNAVEENGAIALIALAKAMSIKDEKPERTTVFVFATGHFQLPQFGIDEQQATSRWLNDHPEFWDGKDGHAKAVAGLTIEHLGCMEWKDEKNNNNYKATGKIDFELVYTANKEMNQIYLDAIKDRKMLRTITLRPRNSLYFGEGQPLFQRDIPTISLVPAPDYLCKVSENGEIDKINSTLLYEQYQTFVKILDKIDSLPSKEFGSVQKQSIGLFY
ncbi:MAG: hypothetical protein PQJ46_00480 [Spirochaetales bacterium]|nr:hypothetical protein [Spirochaetales bacterium]